MVCSQLDNYIYITLAHMNLNNIPSLTFSKLQINKENILFRLHNQPTTLPVELTKQRLGSAITISARGIDLPVSVRLENIQDGGAFWEGVNTRLFHTWRAECHCAKDDGKGGFRLSCHFDEGSVNFAALWTFTGIDDNFRRVVRF